MISILLMAVYFRTVGQSDSVALKRKYESEVIYFSGNKYVKNEVLYPYRNLKSEFTKSKEGQLMFLMNQSDRKKTWVYYGIGWGLYVAGVIAYQNNNVRNSNILYGSALIPLSIALHHNFRADKRLKKSIWLRNRDVLLSK